MTGWKRLAIAAALFGAVASAGVMSNPKVHRPVVRFIHFYEESQSYEQTQDMSLWDRVLYSLLLTKATSS